jgi:hypothetical protein
MAVNASGPAPVASAPPNAEAPEPQPQPVAPTKPAAKADELETIKRQIKQTGDVIKGAHYALKPPKTAVQLRDYAALKDPVSKDKVTEAWVRSEIEPMQRIAGDPQVPKPQRAAANLVAGAGEGLSAKYVISFIHPKDKLAAGRRAFDDVRTAVEQDQSAPAPAIAYAFSLVGIRNSRWKTQAEAMMKVQTAPELERMVPLVAAHKDNLMAQTVVGVALTSLEKDGALSPQMAKYRDGLEARVADLRARNPKDAEDVDDQIREFLSD